MLCVTRAGMPAHGSTCRAPRVRYSKRNGTCAAVANYEDVLRVRRTEEEGDVASRSVPVEPDAKITDLIGRLTDDSKRLITDEVRLAKMEVRESVRLGTRGLLWMALAFGFGVVGLVAFTVFLTTIIGRVLIGNLWAGALITGALEVGVGAWLLFRGKDAFKDRPYTLGESRQELRNTAAWISGERTS